MEDNPMPCVNHFFGVGIEEVLLEHMIHLSPIPLTSREWLISDNSLREIPDITDQK